MDNLSRNQIYKLQSSQGEKAFLVQQQKTSNVIGRNAVLLPVGCSSQFTGTYSNLFEMSNFLKVLKIKPESCFREFLGIETECLGLCRKVSGFLELVKVVSQGTLPTPRAW